MTNDSNSPGNLYCAAAVLLALVMGSGLVFAGHGGGGGGGIHVPETGQHPWVPSEGSGENQSDNGVPNAEHPHGNGAADNELPPGVFIDGHHYKLADFKGKVLVLFYFDPASTKSMQSLKERLDAVKVLSARPVKLLGIAKGDASVWPASFHVADVPFPIYADNLLVFGELYGTRHMNFACRVVDAEGALGGWHAEFADIDGAADKAKWTWKDNDFGKQFDRLLELLEWNQFDLGMKQLKTLRKDGIKTTAEAAEKLYTAVKATAMVWKKDADKQAADKPIMAYDLYQRVAMVMAEEDLGKSALDAANTLKTNKMVAQELAARELMAKAAVGLASMKLTQLSQVSDMLAQIRKTCADTPTAAQAMALEHVLNGTP